MGFTLFKVDSISEDPIIPPISIRNIDAGDNRKVEPIETRFFTRRYKVVRPHPKPINPVLTFFESFYETLLADKPELIYPTLPNPINETLTLTLAVILTQL